MLRYHQSFLCFTDYHAITTSYDYDAPLDESGQYTEKYKIVRDLLIQYNPVKTILPDAPKSAEITSYSWLKTTHYISFEKVLTTLNATVHNHPVAMELLDINRKNGQSFGYVVYRKLNVDIPAGGILLIEGRVCDTVMVLVNGKLISPPLEKSADLYKFGTSKIENSTLILSNTSLSHATIDLVVENWGRINVAVYEAFKGLSQGGVKLNGQYLQDWLVFPLDFKKSWTNSLMLWEALTSQKIGPGLYKTILHITDTPKDTFLNIENWTKGIVIVNGFVLGRYARMGPIQTLYLPAPLLRTGENYIVIFEHFQSFDTVKFSRTHIYKSH